MPRKIAEWIAKHDDQAIPERVRLRVFDKYKGICGLSGVQIQIGDEWELDHIKALWKGGEHRESNLWPVLKKPHQIKSGKEKTEKANLDRKRKKHVGITKPKSTIKSRGFQSSGKVPTFDKPALQPKPMFERND